MNIIIIGGGSSGYIIAEYFMREGHNVTVVEQDKKLVEIIRERLDVNVVHGQGADMAVLQEAGISQAELFLALTDGDEVNIIACTLAKYAGVPRKIARLNYSMKIGKATAVALRELGVDEIIDREQILRQENVGKTSFSGATDIKHFMDDLYTVGVFSFDRHSPYYGLKLKDIPLPFPHVTLGYTKISRFLPYDENVEINEFVYVYVGCETKYLELLHQALFPKVKPIRSAMIYRSGYRTVRATVRLAKALQNIGCRRITLVADQPDEAARLSSISPFPVIFGDPSTPLFTQQENLNKVDAFLALSANYERNLFACAVAYQIGVRYTISLVRYPEHVTFMVAADGPLAAKKIGAAPFKKSHFIAVRRGQEFVPITSNLIFRPYDRVLLLLKDAEKDLLQRII